MYFYQPVRNQRFFAPGVLYDTVDWEDFPSIVDAFKKRIDNWYFNPGEVLKNANWNYSFALMAINCLLVDALSQFYYGEFESSRGTFKKFARQQFPAFREKLSIEIQQKPERKTKNKRRTSRKKPLKTYAEVLYHCFRCGILHEAHITVCGGIAGLDGKMVDTDPNICTKYRNGDDCPTVRMDPTVIFAEIKTFFDEYVTMLLDPDKKFAVRRRKFRRKFADSIGVDIREVKHGDEA